MFPSETSCCCSLHLESGVRSPRYRFDPLRSDDKRMVRLMHTWIRSKRDYGLCSVETKFTFKGDSVTSGTQSQLFPRTDCRYFRRLRSTPATIAGSMGRDLDRGTSRFLRPSYSWHHARHATDRSGKVRPGLARDLGGRNVSRGEMAGEMHEQGIPVPRPSTERQG